jgi:alkanesulfonate monooxygenase SsuD/methylene tetrahydromethanopterin reductase-like flavin-dependent oxidoreductase (luciferase family)
MSGTNVALELGVGIPASARPGDQPLALATRAEELGFDFVSASDHPVGGTPTFETWTLLSWIASATSRIRIASRVLGVPYRSPAMVAKMAESFDRLSGGRLILGLGAGSADEEHRAFGLGVRSPREKTTGLEEAITVIRGLWSTTSYSFEGELYRTEDATIEPKPARPIPVWLGTFAPRALALTGRLADGWIPSLSYAGPDKIIGMRERVFEAAHRAGRDPSQITCAYNIELELRKEPGRDESRLVGPAPYVAERLHGFATLGFSAFNFLLGDDSEQLEQLAAEVLPLLRAEA